MAEGEMTPRDFGECLLLEISQQAVERLHLRMFVGAMGHNLFLLEAAEGPSRGRRWFESETTQRDQIL